MKRFTLTLNIRYVLTFTAVILLGLTGCASTSEEEEEPAADTGSEFSDAGATAPPQREPVDETPASAPMLAIDSVHFDFDKSEIRPDATSVLKVAATGLSDGGQSVVIEGHTDNRGSEEYNLALGERRASSVRRYLSNLGVPMGQMTIVSYGEIRPAANGNSESAWSMNRRAEFNVNN
jgi:peptidoglycan-associated lipoprotein